MHSIIVTKESYKSNCRVCPGQLHFIFVELLLIDDFADVTLFQRTPLPNNVVPNDEVTIFCEAIATELYWKVNNSIFFSSDVFQVNVSHHGGTSLSGELSTSATVEINNTMVTCTAHGTSSQIIERVTNIVLAGKDHKNNDCSQSLI